MPNVQPYDEDAEAINIISNNILLFQDQALRLSLTVKASFASRVTALPLSLSGLPTFSNVTKHKKSSEETAYCQPGQSWWGGVRGPGQRRVCAQERRVGCGEELGSPALKYRIISCNIEVVTTGARL